MAISGVLVTNAGGVGTTLTSVSFTPNLNRLYLVAVYQSISGTLPNVPSISTTNGLGFTQIQTQLCGGSSDTRVTIFRGLIAAGASAGTVTANFGGQSADIALLNISEFDGVDTSGSNGSGAIVQNAVASANFTSPITATLAAFGSVNNGTYFSVGWRDPGSFDDATTPTAGFSTLVDSHIAGYSLSAFWRADNSVTCAGSRADVAKGAEVAVEIKASTGGGGGGGTGGGGEPSGFLQFGIGA